MTGNAFIILFMHKIKFFFWNGISYELDDVIIKSK